MSGHPSWCIGTESPDTDHVSKTQHAAESDDPIDIQLRLTQPEDEAGDESRWTTLELEFVDYGQVFGFPLELHQARALADSLVRLLSPDRRTGDVDQTGRPTRPIGMADRPATRS